MKIKYNRSWHTQTPDANDTWIKTQILIKKTREKKLFISVKNVIFFFFPLGPIDFSEHIQIFTTKYVFLCVKMCTYDINNKQWRQNGRKDDEMLKLLMKMRKMKLFLVKLKLYWMDRNGVCPRQCLNVAIKFVEFH